MASRQHGQVIGLLRGDSGVSNSLSGGSPHSPNPTLEACLRELPCDIDHCSISVKQSMKAFVARARTKAFRCLFPRNADEFTTDEFLEPSGEDRTRQDDILDRLLFRRELRLRPFFEIHGYMQTVLLASCLAREASTYVIDEVTEFLPFIGTERSAIIQVLRSLAANGHCVIVADKDLAFLDAVCDKITVLDNMLPGPLRSPYEAIGGFLGRVDEKLGVEKPRQTHGDSFAWQAMRKQRGNAFTLNISEGACGSSSICCLLGEQGAGMTTLLRSLGETAACSVSFLPQCIVPKFKGTVAELLLQKVPVAFKCDSFHREVLAPLGIAGHSLELSIQQLSASMTRCVGMALCLGNEDASLFVLDAPFQHLSCQQKVVAAKILRRFITRTGHKAVVGDKDLASVAGIADSFVILNRTRGDNGRHTTVASSPHAVCSACAATFTQSFLSQPTFHRGFTTHQLACRLTWCKLHALVRQDRALALERKLQTLLCTFQEQILEHLWVLSYPTRPSGEVMFTY